MAHVPQPVEKAPHQEFAKETWALHATDYHLLNVYQCRKAPKECLNVAQGASLLIN